MDSISLIEFLLWGLFFSCVVFLVSLVLWGGESNGR
jgi:hypothetical protein